MFVRTDLSTFDLAEARPNDGRECCRPQCRLAVGLLFLFWVVPDLRSGRTHFLELVERRSNPAVYWLIIGTWIVLSLYLLFIGWSS